MWSFFVLILGYDIERLTGEKTESMKISFDDVPASIREEFPLLEKPLPGDVRVIARQLGRAPKGVVFVAARCVHSKPGVILTIPLGMKGKRIAPPLWLTCPLACRTAASLESSGEIKRISGMLRAHDEIWQAFLEEEKRFSQLSREICSLCFDEKGLLTIGERGIAWGKVGKVKCLHAHLAYMLATNGFEALRRDNRKDLGRTGMPSLEDGLKRLSCEFLSESHRKTKGIAGAILLPKIMELGGIDCARPPDTCID